MIVLVCFCLNGTYLSLAKVFENSPASANEIIAPAASWCTIFVLISLINYVNTCILGV